jgi:tRNA(Ile)-lysidine synthase TilS/MesJ
VLALGQQLDDLCESFMMSMCHNGKIQTMKAHYVIDNKDLRVIRPLAYVRERQLVDFAEFADLPVIAF